VGRRILHGALLNKQGSFIYDDTSRELLYSGAYGAGKTRALCIKIVQRAGHKGAVELLCRRHNTTLKKSTLRTLLLPDGNLPPVLHPSQYTHNKSEQTIKIHGGGEILYFGLDDPQKVGSVPATGVAIDESTELTEQLYLSVRARARVKLKGLRNQVYMATNPDSPNHFLAQRFGISGSAREDGTRYIHAPAYENTFLPSEYVEDLSRFTGLMRKRYYEGLWVLSDRLIYDGWDRETFVRERDISGRTWTRWVVGQDDGYIHPAVTILIVQDSDGRIHAAREWSQSRMTEPQVVNHCLSWQKKYTGIDTWYVDPAAAKLRAEMDDKGLNVEGADNDVQGGIAVVRSFMTLAGDGSPMMTVDPTCTKLIHCLETYERKENSEAPVKVDDDEADALRYGVMGLKDSISAGTPAAVIGRLHRR